MEVTEILKFYLGFCNNRKQDLLRLVNSLYHLGLNGKLWVFKRPKLWNGQYKFAEDLSRVVQLLSEKEQETSQSVILSASYFRTKKMSNLLKKHELLDKELDNSLRELLKEKVIAPNDIFLCAAVIADMLLAERRRYTIQFWTTFLVGVLSVMATIVAAYIGFLK